MNDKLFEIINKKSKKTWRDFIFFYNGYKPLPECSGRRSWTDCGYEYDCDSVHEETCEYCLCNYNLGGKWNPDNGEKEFGFSAFIKYGFRKWWREV